MLISQLLQLDLEPQGILRGGQCGWDFLTLCKTILRTTLLRAVVGPLIPKGRAVSLKEELWPKGGAVA